MTPRRRLTMLRIASSSDSTYSVLPPPMSKVSTGPGSGPSPYRTPPRVRRASSSPVTISTRRPVARPTASAKPRPLDDSRTALVATTRTSTAPRLTARTTYPFTTARVRAIGRLAEHAGVRERLAEPGDCLILVDDSPPSSAGDVSDEEADRVAADVDRGDAHRRKRKRPAGTPAGRRGVGCRGSISP